MQERYGVAADALRLFVHYPPSYYHFHVHITHINWEEPGLLAGKAHLLDNVIDNITEFGGDYYQRSTLSYSIGENEELWQHLKQQQQQ
eukprot:jgi/Chrzof1/4553/Cz14g18030.t1